MSDTGAVTSVPCAVVDTGVLSGFTTVLLFDLGRGGAHASLVAVPELSIVESVATTEAGGDVFDHVVLDHIVDRGILERPSAGADDTDVMVFCRRVKESLSSATVARTPGGGTTLITRAEFETAIRPLLDRSLDAAAELVADDSIDAVILIGGGSAIPILSVAAAEKFGVPVLTAMDPRGARVQAPVTEPRPVPAVAPFAEDHQDDTMAIVIDRPHEPAAAQPHRVADVSYDSDMGAVDTGAVDTGAVDMVAVDMVDVGGEAAPEPRRSRLPVALVLAFSCAIMAGAAAWAFTAMPEPMDPATIAPTSSVAPVGSRGVPPPVTTTVDPFADESDSDFGGGGDFGGGSDVGGDFGGGSDFGGSDFGGGGGFGGF